MKVPFFPWTTAIAFYSVQIMQSTGIPLNPFMMAAGLTGYRALLMVLSAPLIARFKRRHLYFVGSLFLIAGQLGIALFYHLDAIKYSSGVLISIKIS